MEEADNIKTMVDILEICLLPELSKELGTTDIKTSDFDNFRESLDINLVELFDLIQRNENYLFNNEKDFLELKTKLILMLCEQTSPDANALFQTRKEHLLKNLNVLCDKHFENILNTDIKAEENIINFYKLKLNTLLWKKNIGSAYGFLQFLIKRYEKTNKIMDIKFSTFVLSVGLLLRDFYEPFYKKRGIDMFNIILRYTAKKDIKEMNIHNVIYEETLKDISKFEKSFEIEVIWNCLYDCLVLMDDICNTHKWTKIDDLIKNLINQIIFAKSSDNWIVLFNFLLKFCLVANKNQSEMVRIINDNNIESIDKILIIRKTNTEQSIISYRWLKSVLQLFGVESNYLMGNETITLKALQIMHITYLICIFPIEFKIIEPHLIEFIEKWVLILMEALRIHKNNFVINQNIKEFLITLLIQIESFRKTDKCKKLEEFNNSIKLLLDNEIFINKL